jgi:hypothetical protein
MNRAAKTLICVIAMTSVSAFARTGTAVKNRPAEVAPGRTLEVRPTENTRGATQQIRDARGVRANDLRRNGVAQQTSAPACSMDVAVSKLIAGTRLNVAQAETALKSGLVIAGCSAGEEGILNFNADAREVAVQTVLIKKDRGVKAVDALVAAKKEVKGIETTAAVEQANLEMLSNGKDCKVFTQAFARN